MSEKSLGLNGLGKIRKNKTFRPERIEPKVSETIRRSLPDDQILMHYTRKLKAKDTPKSVQTQIDTHMAIKQIGIVENKKNYEVINELVEKIYKWYAGYQEKTCDGIRSAGSAKYAWRMMIILL